MNDDDQLPDIVSAIREIYNAEGDEALCASFRLAEQETPWVQIVPGLLNIWWPFPEEESARRLREVVSGVSLSDAELEEMDAGVFACFRFGEASHEQLAAAVDWLFCELYGCEANCPLDVEIYVVQDDQIPDAVPIKLHPDSPTKDIGSFGDGNQFLGCVTATFATPIGEEWRRSKRWHAVLHTFDRHGAHLQTQSWFAGTSADGESEVRRRAEERLAQMIADLGPVQRGDIAIQLFATEVDGQEAGLFDTTWEDEEQGAVYVEATLLPNDLAFSEPWDGDWEERDR